LTSRLLNFGMRLTGSKLISIRSGEISRIETQLDDERKLRSYPNEDIQQLQLRLDKTEEKIQVSWSKGSNRQQVTTLTLRQNQANYQAQDE